MYSCRLTYGGSLIRPESTGFGTVYFVQEILKDQNSDLKVVQAPVLFRAFLAARHHELHENLHSQFHQVTFNSTMLYDIYEPERLQFKVDITKITDAA